MSTATADELQRLFELQTMGRYESKRREWRELRHPFQVPPDGKWRAWMLKAGRGAGKTRTGAQDAIEYCMSKPGSRYAIVAPTQADARTVCFEGDSGVVNVLRDMGVEFEYRPSILELRLFNGSLITGYSAEKPDRLRGPQFHRAWCDELAAWKDAHLGDALNTTYNNLQFGLRLGEDARMVITTTPRRVELVRQLLDHKQVVVTEGTTYDNLVNLSPVYAMVIEQYEGSNIGRQEIFGELIDEVEGALWTHAMIDRDRLHLVPDLSRVVVAVDPPGGATEAGIVAAGITAGACNCERPREQLPHVFVLADGSLMPTGPDAWGQRAIEVFYDTEADRIVAEVNFGGDMVRNVIRGIDRDVPYKDVRATRGKQRRAEPVVALYEQHRVHHVDVFPNLEDEMTTWVEEDKWSPNRLDALVWAVTELAPWRQRRKLTGIDLTSDLGKAPGVPS